MHCRFAQMILIRQVFRINERHVIFPFRLFPGPAFALAIPSFAFVMEA
jgi:hypothetical protein